MTPAQFRRFKKQYEGNPLFYELFKKADLALKKQQELQQTFTALSHQIATLTAISTSH